MTLSLNVDVVKHALGRWTEEPLEAGMQARRLALAVAREHLLTGHGVVIGQYLARTEFIEQLEQLAARVGVPFVEIVLELDAATLADRLAARAAAPDRIEHSQTDRSVGPEDAEHLVESIRALRTARPRAVWIDARGPLSSTLTSVRAALG